MENNVLIIDKSVFYTVDWDDTLYHDAKKYSTKYTGVIREPDLHECVCRYQSWRRFVNMAVPYRIFNLL